MSSIRLIKRRIKVARNISQITKAMEMVAASKMRKAQQKAVAGKPYAQKIYDVTHEVTGRITSTGESIPLLKTNESLKKLIILITTTKGLCGGLNTNLFRQLNQWFSDRTEYDFVTFGKKGQSFILRTGRQLVADFSNINYLDSVGALMDLITIKFIDNTYQEVWLVYNNFISILNQEPTKEMILPIINIENNNPVNSDMLMEPDPITLMNQLLPRYIEVSIRRAILEAEASEHSARMIAMKNATDSANQLMENLTLDYNKVRQQMITYEIADIVTAREAIQS
ncbi:MAG: ATP synthase F1 subunit gamma [Candidatus Gottesmanbacteria bacterium]